MKKGIIVLAVLFIVSSLLVLISAVALGASGISQLVGYLRQEDSAEFRQDAGDFANKIAEGAKLFGEKIQDGAEEFADSNDLFDGRDFSIIGNPDLHVAGGIAGDFEVFGHNEIKIHADIADVVIKTTDKVFVSASADIYSKKKNPDPNEVDMLFDEKGYDIYLKADKHVKDTVCQLTVEIPEDFDGKIIISVDVGDISFDNVAFNELDAKVAVGEINADKATFDTVNLAVDTGDVKVGKGFICNELNIRTQIGSVEYALPDSKNVDITYTVETGGANVEKLDNPDFVITSTSEAGFSGLKTEGNITVANGTADSLAVLKINIEVGIGGIEFDV